MRDASQVFEIVKTEITTHIKSQCGEIWEHRIVAIAADCKSALTEFGGSSPSAPTK